MKPQRVKDPIYGAAKSNLKHGCRKTGVCEQQEKRGGVNLCNRANLVAQRGCLLPSLAGAFASSTLDTHLGAFEHKENAVNNKFNSRALSLGKHNVGF
jgi:hypothetical protein